MLGRQNKYLRWGGRENNCSERIGCPTPTAVRAFVRKTLLLGEG